MLQLITGILTSRKLQYLAMSDCSDDHNDEDFTPCGGKMHPLFPFNSFSYSIASSTSASSTPFTYYFPSFTSTSTSTRSGHEAVAPRGPGQSEGSQEHTDGYCQGRKEDVIVDIKLSFNIDGWFMVVRCILVASLASTVNCGW